MSNFLDKDGLSTVLTKIKTWVTNTCATKIKLNNTTYEVSNGICDLGTISGTGTVTMTSDTLTDGTNSITPLTADFINDNYITKTLGSSVTVGTTFKSVLNTGELCAGIWLIVGRARTNSSVSSAVNMRANINSTSASTAVLAHDYVPSGQYGVVSCVTVLKVLSANTYYLNVYSSSSVALSTDYTMLRAIRLA